MFMKVIKCSKNEIALTQLLESMYAGNCPIVVWIDKSGNIRLICQRDSEIFWVDLSKAVGPFPTNKTNLEEFLTEILDKGETVECFYSIQDLGKWLANLE